MTERAKKATTKKAAKKAPAKKAAKAKKAPAAGMRVRKPGKRSAPASTPTDDAVRELEVKAERSASKAPGQIAMFDSGNQDSGSHGASHEAEAGKGIRWRRKRDGAAMRASTIHLPVDLAAELRVYCAERDRKQSEVIAEALRAFLASS